jgi:hypothetical protein
LTKEKADKKKRKQKPFLDTKEKPCRDDTQKEKIPLCVRVRVKCVRLTHIPLRQKKNKRRNVYNKDGKKIKCARRSINNSKNFLFFSPFENKFTFSFSTNRKCVIFRTKLLYNI